jgi:hypothetical protein
VSAKKLSKRELANKRRAKAAQAKRDKREPLSPLDVWAIEVHEAFLALKRQGFTAEHAMDYITQTYHRFGLPDWQVDNPDHSPFEDEEDED